MKKSEQRITTIEVGYEDIVDYLDISEAPVVVKYTVEEARSA